MQNSKILFLRTTLFLRGDDTSLFKTNPGRQCMSMQIYENRKVQYLFLSSDCRIVVSCRDDLIQFEFPTQQAALFFYKSASAAPIMD